MKEINDTLNERGSRYGEYENHAKLTYELKDAFYSHQKIFSSTKLESQHKEAIDLILHKLARIANGDPNYDDNWIDIAGYSTLVVKWLNKSVLNHVN